MKEPMKLLCTKRVTMTVVDEERTGHLARSRRVSLALSLRECGKALNCSFVYLADLELGRRGWDAPIGKRYLKFLEGK